MARMAIGFAARSGLAAAVRRSWRRVPSGRPRYGDDGGGAGDSDGGAAYSDDGDDDDDAADDDAAASQPSDETSSPG